LFIIGNGGEGKSTIGNVVNEIFKKSMISGSLQDILHSRFNVTRKYPETL